MTYPQTETSAVALDTATPRSFHLDRRAGRLAGEIAAGGDPDELLSDSQLAELTGYSVVWFQVARCKGYAPPFVRLSPRRVRTRRSDYVQWLLERTHRATSEYDTGATGRKPGSKVIGGKVIAPEPVDAA
jgi:predicted DNA-binding transcriptional regulator AlpA